MTLPLLTDDEVVALSVGMEMPWRTVLPTVEVEVPEALIAAVARGTRSLYVRGLLDTDTDTVDAALREEFRRVSERPVRVAVYAMSAEGLMLPGTAAQYYFAAPQDDSWTWDGIAAGGVHTFGTSTPTEALEELNQAIHDVLANGVGGSTPEQPLQFALISQADDRVRQLKVAKDAVAAYRQEMGGAAVEVHLAGRDPENALNWLLETH